MGHRVTYAFREFGKEARFSDLVSSVQHCNLCPRLCSRRKVFSEANGNFDSRVFFVAEAPGRFGADRTGVPLCGDRTGDNFEALLLNVGWRREQVFVTNAILCNPQDEAGHNGTPTQEEIANCSAYLKMAIVLVKPEIIVTLGATALRALEGVSPHGIKLRDGVAQMVPWMKFRLFPLYHPAPRATIHRSLAKQRSDFVRLAKLVDPNKGLIERKPRRKAPVAALPAQATSLHEVARAILSLGGRMTYFKLTKLLYLVDLAALHTFGHLIASDVYLRQVDGPWPPRLRDALSAMDGHEVRFLARRVPGVAPGPSPRWEVELDVDVLDLIAEVFEKHGHLSNSRIKNAVYLTEPMRFVLKEENKGKDMRNKPVLYKDKTARELNDK